jgi:hypothetical protein
MKNLLVIVGTVGLLHAPAVAGGNKKVREAKKPVVASVDKTHAARPVVADAELPQLPELVFEIPELPHDTSSALVPFPELEAERAMPVTHKRDKKVSPPVMNIGKSYVLGKRDAAKPTVNEVQHVVPRSLSQAQVATVVQSHMGDIQSCWTAVPKAERVDACTAELKLTISESGVVTDIELGGAVPASARRCISSAVSRWTFPVAETRSEVDYGISLRSL